MWLLLPFYGLTTVFAEGFIMLYAGLKNRKAERENRHLGPQDSGHTPPLLQRLLDLFPLYSFP